MNNNVLAVEQNIYATKVVNAYIVDDVDNLNPLNNFVLQNYLIGATNKEENSDKIKYVYISSWSFISVLGRASS